VACREIKFDRVKEYVIDDQIRDLHHLSRLKITCLLPILGLYFDPKVSRLCIFMPKMISLYSYLHEGSRNPTAETKKKLALAIARAMKEIHDYPKDVSDSQQSFYSHQHLSPHNIMLRDETNVDSVLIADMGSHGLRKYASFFMGYN
jgi:hypothetical protein